MFCHICVLFSLYSIYTLLYIFSGSFGSRIQLQTRWSRRMNWNLPNEQGREVSGNSSRVHSFSLLPSKSSFFQVQLLHLFEFFLLLKSTKNPKTTQAFQIIWRFIFFIGEGFVISLSMRCLGVGCKLTRISLNRTIVSLMLALWLFQLLSFSLIGQD